MLTSFFGASKPINFAVIVLGVILFLTGYYTLSEYYELTALGILSRFMVLLLYLFSLGVLNFVVKRNTLTRRTTYIVFFFACFTLAIPQTFFNTNTILSGLFVLLALRRIISLKSEKDQKKKIFDAAFWIAIASLFFFWSLLFLVVLYFAILFYTPNEYRNWLLPFASLFTVFILTFTFSLYYEGAAVFARNYVQLPTYDFSAYNNLRLLLPTSFIITLYLWCGFRYISQISDVSQKLKASYLLTFISSVVALFIAIILAPDRDGSELYFLFGPLAIITANYIETSTGFWFKEMMMWLALLIPFMAILWSA
ncbi:MAG: hypothetical protein COA80_09115 [Leeuwenhoekiella sp.]|nr:MAG: hypothetical protein COA80_09115 [Leeuwenhoekiella sp.]